MNNLFISKTKAFYNYIISTHCKDFKKAFDEYYSKNESHFSNEWFNTDKVKRKSLENLYSVLRNNEFVAIKNYIFREYSEEERFENWIKLLRNFGDFVYEFTDPLMINSNNIVSVNKDNDKSIFEYKCDNFSFIIKFEKSKIKSGTSTLFDSITGLDKENTLTFIKIEIKNNFSGNIYKYKYVEDSSLINENELDDDICDLQLEMVKEKLDNFIYDYIGIVFDTIINYDLKQYIKDFHIFNSTYIRNKYKELEEKWLETMNMESD